MIDIRCLQNDHHFREDELYDEYSGDPLPNQADATCTRCGITMHQSLVNIAAECKQIIEDKLTKRRIV